MMRKIYYYLRGLISYYKMLRFKKHNELEKTTYFDLWKSSFCNKKFFLKFKADIIKKNIEEIKSKQVCSVGFVVYTTSMWSVDGIYKIMCEDIHYKPTILVVPFVGASEKTYKDTIDYFVDKGYQVDCPDYSTFDINKYDLLIYTNPYFDMSSYLYPLALNKLVAYVSYSYILSDKSEKLDLPLYLLSWKFFCDSEFYKKLVECKSRIYSNNAVFCGYPKMDSYYHAEVRNNNKAKGRKVIIYAPHQSVNYSGEKAATFDKNGWFLLYLAEKYKDQIYWIVKPHPLLRCHSVEAGIFDNEDSYSDYLKRWEDTGAAEVLENGDYFSLFRESDAMITDSVSFLAEYQFTGKPLLLLESGKQSFNDFGKSIKDILYRCDGNDYIGIDNYLMDVLNGKDPMREKRTLFFEKKISYNQKVGKLANDNMYELMNEELFGC